LKRRKVRDLIRNHSIDFLALQETNLEVISEALCHSLWGSHDCDWVYLPSEGRSGGVLSIWSKSNNSLIFSFIGERFVCVCLEWGIIKTICIIAMSIPNVIYLQNEAFGIILLLVKEG
jgi:hypothetical protein